MIADDKTGALYEVDPTLHILDKITPVQTPQKTHRLDLIFCHGIG